jgi:hypothetical protein
VCCKQDTLPFVMMSMSQEPPDDFPGREPPTSLSPQDERLARLRALRKQRQDVGTGPLPPEEFRRRGLPTPPPEQPSFQQLVKHLWHHGPLGGLPPGYKKPTDAEAGNGETGRGEPPVPQLPTPYEERAKELLAQGRKSLSLASVKAQKMMNQARGLMNQRMPSQPHLPSQPRQPSQPHLPSQPPAPPPPEIVPGMILIGFELDVPMEQAIKEITALGGKPLRHKESQNLFQVAVPPGEELVLMQQLLLRPGVVLADLERKKPPRP